MTQIEDSFSHCHVPDSNAKVVLEALDRLDAEHSLEIQKHILMIRQLQQARQQQTPAEQAAKAQPDFIVAPFRSAA
jgi:hypothetical protein